MGFRCWARRWRWRWAARSCRGAFAGEERRVPQKRRAVDDGEQDGRVDYSHRARERVADPLAESVEQIQVERDDRADEDADRSERRTSGGGEHEERNGAEQVVLVHLRRQR